MTTTAPHLLISQIDALLPQTQCTQCDYPRCLDYAGAIANGDADINQCPPGGTITIDALADLTGRPAKPLNPSNGEHEPRQLAVIDEAACIGCKLCIKACPVDCIIGAGKLMHTVIAVDCTGCKLCVPACPTDCIDLVDFAGMPGNQAPSQWPDFSQPQVEKARRETARKIKREEQKTALRAKQKAAKERRSLQQEIQAVLARKRSG